MLKKITLELDWNLNIKKMKEGGLLPLIIVGIGAASTGAGSAITDSKHKKRMEQETIRNNKGMEKINSKTSQGSEFKKMNNF